MKNQIILVILKLRGIGWGDLVEKPFDKWLYRHLK